MGRKKVDNSEYIKKFSSRLYKLAESYIEQKENERKEKNAEIERLNKKGLEDWKALSRPVSNFPKKPLLPKYTRQSFCDEVSRNYGVNFPYKNYNLYTRGEAFPDQTKLIYALSQTLGVSFEYLYGLSDEKNEVTAAVGKIIPLSPDAINTLRSISGNKEVITILNTLLSDTGACFSELMNLHEQQYHIYKERALKGTSANYDYDIMQRRFISAELFANYIEDHLSPATLKAFEERLNNDLAEEQYRSEHYEEDRIAMIKAIQEYEEQEYGSPTIKVTAIKIGDSQQ